MDIESIEQSSEANEWSSLETNFESLPDQIVYESNNPYISGKTKTVGIAQTLFPGLDHLLRESFYLPNPALVPHHMRYCANHAHNVSNMLKGEICNFDPTFPSLPVLHEHYDVREISITIESEGTSFVTTLRAIESKPNEPGHGLRLILFAFHDNQTVLENSITAWNPRSPDQISAAPLEVLKALGKHITVDSMMCFSLGAMALDGLKNVSPEEADFVPKTLILNRALTSIWKVTSQLYPILKWILYALVKLFGLEANPEGETVSFLQRVSQYNEDSMTSRRIIAFEATRDNYFSGVAALDSDFASQIRATNARVDHGKFHIPLLPEAAHHACRLDYMFNNPDSDTDTTSCLDMRINESVTQALIRAVFADTGNGSNMHTCFMVGGNSDNTDSMTYLQVLPLLETHFKQASSRIASTMHSG